LIFVAPGFAGFDTIVFRIKARCRPAILALARSLARPSSSSRSTLLSFILIPRVAKKKNPRDYAGIRKARRGIRKSPLAR